MTFRLVLYIAGFVTYLAAFGFSASPWQNNLQASRDIYISFGERHSREHFPTSQHLSDALLHQLEALSLGAERVGSEDEDELRKVDHPFMSCAPYFEYDALILRLAASVGDSFESHLSYASAVENQICFVVFVKDTAALRVYVSSLIVSELSHFVPVPDILKIDHSLIRALDWMIEQGQEASDLDGNAARDQKKKHKSALMAHPIIGDIAEGNPIELSIIFRPSWSPVSQEESASNWIESLLHNAEKSERTLSERMSHWDSFLWTAASANKRDTDGEYHKGSHIRTDSKDWSSIYERVRTLSPYSGSDIGGMNTLEKDLNISYKMEGFEIRERWAALQHSFVKLHADTTKIENGDHKLTEGGIEDKCDYTGITVQHRKNNVNLIFGPDFFKYSNRSAACLANIVVLLSADKGVSRMALSTPPQLLNDVARRITQSAGAANESYGISGLNGTGVVVGIADTGIDEMSCYFKDAKGFVPRSSALKPYTDLGRRKVVQYISFSGSSGDVASGHGTHVAGSVAGYSTGYGNEFKGMAPGSKLAFFDILPTSTSRLVLPKDLAKTMFPPAYAAGARLHSNSWGGGYFYNAYCIEVDEYLYKHSDFLVLFAAGNSGGDGAGTIGAPGLSKNALTVGASVNSITNMGSMADFSSIGPTFDGRLKPDVTAPGLSVTSAYATSEINNFESCTTVRKAGTSMATPIVAGTAALVIQYFKDPKFWVTYCNPAYVLCSNGAFSPLGPTVKALMMHSAVAMDRGPAPDVYQGYGRVDLLNILPLVSYSKSPYTLFLDQTTITPLTEFTYKVAVKSTLQPLKMTISWFDPPNTEFAARVLVHDLDLLLVSPSGKIFYGNGGINVRDELNNVRDGL